MEKKVGEGFLVTSVFCTFFICWNFNCVTLKFQAYEWALEAMKYMSRVKPEDVQHPGQSVKQLRQYLMTHRPPATEHFTEMAQLAQKLRNEKLLEQCKVSQAASIYVYLQYIYFY